MKHYSIRLILIFSILITRGQSPKYRVTSIPVQKNGTWMRDPWVGGMDCPQFSIGDLNQDGIQDLFVFDRTGNRVYTYLGNGGAPDTMFTYAPQYESLFPTWLSNWALLRDYNHDGIPDIFTWVGEGCSVMKGNFSNSLLRFDNVSPFLKYTAINAGNGQIHYPNVFVLSVDLPGIMDINGDGDLDVLAYDVAGGQVAYYENETVEHGATGAYAYDSLRYRLVTTCWGEFAQNTGTVSGNSITLHIDTGLCTFSDENDTIYSLPPQGSGNQRHSGNSLFPIIDPVTNSIDLLNGNVSYNDLMFLRNCAARSNPYGDMCVWDSIFPPSPCTGQILMYQYPAAFGIPISNDSLQDLLISPNVPPAYEYSGGNARNINNVLWYKNLNDTTCWYESENDSFLVHHMLDFGTNSRGVFYDFDGDGLMDIIVGNFGYFNPNFLPSTYQSTLAYYHNIGTATQPAFQQVTLDYDSFSNYHLLAMSPTFGDLDGDGKPDMVLGDQTGFLYFCKNMATGIGSSYPVITLQHFDTLQVTGYAAPFIFDVNGDSLNDLLVGSDNGFIYYYQNTGTKTQPHFSRTATSDSFGRVNVCSYGSIDGCFAQPFVMKDSAGNLILYVGSEAGVIFKYLINPDSLTRGTFQLLDSNVIGRAIGANATISVADINTDGKMEYLIGTSTGGLLMYSDSDWDPSTSLGIYDIPVKQDQLKIYPNPARDYFVCTAVDGDFINPRVDVYNVLGEKVNVGLQLSNNQITVNTEQLSNGFYVIRITDAGKSYPGKVLVAR